MKNNVAILTNFQDINLGYSLTGIVIDQCQMLLRHGHKVFLFVNERFNHKYDEDSGLKKLLMNPDFTLEKKTKFMHLTDYTSSLQLSPEHKSQQEEAAEIYFQHFKKNNIKVVFTHDFVFTGWNLPYAAAVNTTSKKLRADSVDNKSDVRWFHWIHSVPSGKKDWWMINQYGPGHQLVFPNSTDRLRVMETFEGTPRDVVVIPHIKDIRSYYDFGGDAWDIIDQCPNLMRADVIQVYPCSTDRLEAKQVDILLAIFASMKKNRASSFILFANQWATGKQRKEDVNKYIQLGSSLGLDYKDDFAFTSDLGAGYSNGISRRCLRELQLLSNLFIFPTKEESFGLVGPEASLSGAMLVVNRSLTMMFEVLGTESPNYDFGSFHQNTPTAKDPAYMEAVAFSVLRHLAAQPALLAKVRCRKKYNMDSLYQVYSLHIN